MQKQEQTQSQRSELLAGFHCLSSSFINEPPHDKTNKMTVRPAKTQISLGIRPVPSESSLSAWRKLGSLANHWAHSEDSADAQADLSLRWAHNHFVGFVMRRLISSVTIKNFVSSFDWDFILSDKLLFLFLSSAGPATRQISVKLLELKARWTGQQRKVKAIMVCIIGKWWYRWYRILTGRWYAAARHISVYT